MDSCDNVEFHELTKDDFPFTVKLISLATGDIVKEVTVDGPGIMTLPAMPKGSVRVEIHWPDGQVDR